MISDHIRPVPPSGDTTGATDTAAIQAAIDALTTATVGVSEYAYGPLGTVVLQGRYYLSGGLVSGDVDAPRSYGPCVISAGNALLECVGDSWTETDYALQVHGNTVGDKGGFARTVLSGLKIKANHKSRGILLGRQYHMAGIERIHIEETVQTALDVATSWKSFIRDVHILNCRGFAMRVGPVVTGSNDNICIDNVRIGYVRGIWHADNDADPFPLATAATASRNLALYEVKYGYGAAVANYGDDYKENWPAADDTTAPIYTQSTDAMNYFTTPADERCCLWLASPHVTLRNIMFENCYYGDRPLIFIPKAQATQVRIEDLYLEKNYNTDCKVYVQGYASDGGSGNVQLRNVHCGEDLSDYDADAKCRFFMRCDGESAGSVVSNVLVDNIQVRGIDDGVIVCGGPGTYHNIRVRNARTISGDPLLPHQWVVQTVGAEVTTDTPYKTNTSDLSRYVASGTGTVASGDTTVDITHGLSVTPTADEICVTPTNISSASVLAVTATASDTFTVTTDADPTGSGQTFSWRAKCDPNDHLGTLVAEGETVTNGTFDSDLTGWTNHATSPWDTAEYSGGRVHLAADGDGSPSQCRLYQELTLVSGQQYKVSGKITGTGTVAVTMKKTAADGAAFAVTPAANVNATVASDGRFAALMTPTQTSVFLCINGTNSGAIDVYLDDMSCVPNTITSMPDSVPA